MYDYKINLKPKEVEVSVLDYENKYDELISLIKEAGKQYGFTYTDIKNMKTSSATIRHLIILSGWDNPELVYKEFEDIINLCTSATLSVSYSSLENMKKASPVVEKLKAQVGDKVNFLLPTLTKIGTYEPTLEKLVDNSICDSVRVKYKPKYLGKLMLEDFSNEYIRYFEKMSKLIEEYTLFHRSNTDGFISIKNPEGGFFITSTKTPKINLDLKRITLIKNYTEETNTISYYGNYLPSSDSVECAIVYKRHPEIKAILHVHASNKITRNPIFSHKIAVPPMRYGEISLGEKVAEASKKSEFSDYLIMDDHGELFFSKSDNANLAYDEIEHTVKNIIGKCNGV